MKGAKEVRVDYPQEIVHRVCRLNPVPAQHRYWQQHMPSKLGENLSPIFNYSALPIVLTLSYIPPPISCFNVGGPSRHPYARMNILNG